LAAIFILKQIYMKKIFTQLFIACLVSSGAFAQLTNTSFETWQNYSGVNIFSAPFSGEYPTGWQTTDSIVQYGTGPHTAVRELTDICNGSNSVKLTSGSALGNLVPGALTNGKITGPATITGGSPYTLRTAFLNGCYKYVPTGTDTGRVTALLSKWNGLTRDTIAFAYDAPSSVPTMIPFQIPFVYRSANSPDTLLIMFASGRGVGATTAGSYMVVDNVSLSGTVGVNENVLVKNIHIFPQPAQNELNISVELSQNTSMTYEVADITGKRIITGKMETSSTKIDISSLSRGNYFIALHDETGAVLYTSRFSVAK
jgi:hypothetical protein